jgi:hypothetical protein
MHAGVSDLAWCRHAQIGDGFRPCSGEVGMRQRLALIAIKKNDVAGCGLLLIACKDPIHPDAPAIEVNPLETNITIPFNRSSRRRRGFDPNR